MEEQIKIFVSYSHADMEPRPGFKESRVSHILRDVKFDLRVADKRSGIVIVRDKEGALRAGDRIYETLDRAIDDCDIGLLLLSESYCRSESCIAEFRRFLDQQKPIFLVETDESWSDLSEEHEMRDLHAAVSDILAVQFWGIEDEGAVQYGFPLPHADAQERQTKYYEAMRYLVVGMKARVNALREGQIGIVGPHSHPTSGTNVLIACPTPDVAPEADRLERELLNRDIVARRFQPEKGYQEPSRFEEAFRAELEKADVYIQLFGALPGREIVAGSGQQLVASQYRIASEECGIAVLWRSPAFDPEDCDPAYAGFLGGLNAHDTNFEEFVSYAEKTVRNVVSQLEAKEKQEEEKAASGEDGQMFFVAIDADESDDREAQALQDFLGRYVMVNRVPTFLDDREVLSAATSGRDGVVFVYGKKLESQKRAWVHLPYVLRSSLGKIKCAVGDTHPKLENAGGAQLTGPRMKIIRVESPEGGEPQLDTSALLEFLSSLGVDPQSGSLKSGDRGGAGDGR